LDDREPLSPPPVEPPSGPMKPFLSIVIPVYNGGPLLLPNIGTVLKYMDSKPFPCELVIVEDGSTDNTLKELATVKDERVRLLPNERNMGKGFSVKRGMLSANGEYIVFTDADLAYPIEQVDNLLKGLEEGNDIVIGSRVHRDSKFVLHCEDLRYIFRRHILSRAFNLFLRLTLISGILDTQSGFKGFRKSAAEYVFSRQRASDFSFDLEILYLAQKSNMRIKEIPVTMEYQGGPSAVSMFRDSFSMVARVFKILIAGCTGSYVSSAGKPAKKEGR